MLVGKVFEKVKAFSESEIKLFGALVADSNPIHYDPEVAKRTIFKQPIAQGMLVGSLFSGLIGSNLPRSVYLNQTLKFTKPVYIDEELLVQVAVREEKLTEKGTKLILDTVVKKRSSLPNGPFDLTVISGEAVVLLLTEAQFSNN